MNFLILILKGLIIGIGKVIPGVSGSVLAILLNIYEESIRAINDLFKNFSKSFFYLGPLGIGILISIILGSKLIIYLLNNYYFITFSIIIGLILGTLPNFLKKVQMNSFRDFLFFIIPFILFISFEYLNINFNIINNYLLVFLLGIIEAFTTIIPGISSSAIYISFNVYQVFLNIFSNPFNCEFLIFSMGLFIGIYLTSKLVNYLFNNHKKESYLIIFSLIVSSIIVLFKLVIQLNDFNYFLFILLLIVGFVISYIFDK